MDKMEQVLQPGVQAKGGPGHHHRLNAVSPLRPITPCLGQACYRVG